ncbi:metal ABC transporter permease [Arsenicicoccus sp. oral taxon 190]|uniref:metal ABC transporter permease n=1 Tax=Arsenicicoccus sp. oral taxon 190 TaxID=1658671 RepID=UPI00067A231C|nr:metal ABC transporter permease [Arsenicicoccus sp. oral taxon 190]AKT51134.1 metal ABC transporter [Arsenicicoccus sp. oral taxon 190]
MLELWSFEFMQRALVAALLVGAAAPMVGTFLVQRRMSLIGDGMGHVALAGVSIGLITGQQPVWTALVAAIVCAVAIEVIQRFGRASGDIALALMFYGGIALGVVLMSRATAQGGPGLTSYLFGSITTTSREDLAVFGVLAVVVMATTWVLRPRLFAVANDEEWSRAAGLPVLALNIVLAVLTAVTVVVAMRVVGLLLISALMILPNAAAQQVTRSFRATRLVAVVIGVLCATGGVAVSYQLDTPSGGTIVLMVLGAFLVLAVAAAVARAAGARHHRLAETHEHDHGPGCGHRAVAHGDHTDYLHDGHLHAPHEGHYDEHGPGHQPGHAPGRTAAGDADHARPQRS